MLLVLIHGLFIKLNHGLPMTRADNLCFQKTECGGFRSMWILM